MPSKRKRTTTHATSPRPEVPRRSSRRLKEQTVTEDHDSSRMDIDDADGERSIGALNLESTEALQRTMRELGEMEARLQNVARRQRLAVETSDLHVEVEPPVSQISLKPRSLRLSAKPGADLWSQEQKPLGGDDASGDLDEVTEESHERGANRPLPVNSDRLPLPWMGRLGYACLNTYLRAANPPVFSSRTCRISSIIDHRHPLQDPSQPEHPTKNRPDRNKPADIERGQKYLQQLGLANAKDIVKMIRWNHKYGIKFMRLSSEMFPFASHQEYGYKLAPFASEVLAEAGKVAAELGHRLTTHPGQFTQIGSPKKEVVAASVRDLQYHDEMLSLLNLPEQMDRDAVMILHMGGVYGDKDATLDRFRENYAKLPDSVKRRLVLENDDVSWSVHDLLPICEELDIPLVLDFHHHNIVFDSSVREGTQDIIGLFDRISKTWKKKGIAQKMHYSEQTRAAVTPRERRKHSARVKTLPPCPNDMDLMIEAKDKEQAVFELMRTFKLPGWDSFNDIVPYERDDEPQKPAKKIGTKKGKKKANGISGEGVDGVEADVEIPEKIVSADDFGMGGPQNRVYWPEGMEEWLKPKKREVKKTKKDKD